MKRLFYPEGSIENKITYYHLLFFLLTLPFDRFYSTIILVSFLVHTIIYLRKEKIRNIGTTTLVLQAVFFVTVISSLYAPSFAGAMNVVSKQLAIFLCPVLFSLIIPELKRYRPSLLLMFAIGCTCTVVYLYIDAILTIRYSALPVKALFTAAFINHNFSLPIDMHATYLSMFLLLSIIYLFQRTISETVWQKKLFFIFCNLILAAGLMQLSSKSALLSILIIVNIFFPWLLFKGRKAWRFLFVSVAATILVCTFIMSVDVFRERFFVDLKHDLSKAPESEKMTWRIKRWEAAATLIKKSPVIGSGTGSELPLLKSIYFERKMYGAYLSSLNVHNQFLSFLVNSGIIGLLVYLCTLGWGFWKAIKYRDLPFLSFMLLITVVSFSENMLDVNKGIFFYAFFFSFFVMSGKEVVPEKPREATMPPY